MRALEVARLIDGQLEGDPDRLIGGVAPLTSAGPDDLTFLVHGRHSQALAQSRAGCLLTDGATWQQCAAHRPQDLTVILCANPLWAMAKIYGQLCPPVAAWQGRAPSACIDGSASVHPSAHVGPGAVICAGAQVGPEAQIGPQAFVGASARVGARTVLHPGARVLWGCTVGDDCILHPGCVIGGDGFGLAPSPHGPEHLKVPQMGAVEVGHRVEIGANSTIDRATFGATRIGDGCKIDNLVQVGHNVTLGKHCVVVSQSGIAGSATLGDSITVGAQAGIVGHCHIAAGTTLAARTGVISSLPEPGVYAGAPAMEHRAWLRMMAALRDLAPMRKRLAALCRQQPPPNEVS